MKRHKVNQRKAAKSFTRNAMKSKPQNAPHTMTRGGYRM